MQIKPKKRKGVPKASDGSGPKSARAGDPGRCVGKHAPRARAMEEGVPAEEADEPVRVRQRSVRDFAVSRSRSSAAISLSTPHQVDDRPTTGDADDEDVEEPATFRWEHAAAQFVIHMLYPLSLTFAERAFGVKLRNQWLTCPVRAPPQEGQNCCQRVKAHGKANQGNLNIIAVYAIAVLWLALGEELELLTSGEVLLLLMVHTLRVVMIAVKYGFMCLADYETITLSDDQSEVVPLMLKDLLLLWSNPSDDTISAEILQAAAERGFQQDEAIQFATAKFHFTDCADSRRLLKMLGSTTCKGGHSVEVENSNGESADRVTLRVADVCFDIFRKVCSDTWNPLHEWAARLISIGVVSLPFFWRVDHYGWRNICGRPEQPLEIVLIAICAYLLYLFYVTNLHFMLVCLYDFQRRYLALKLCIKLIKPSFSLQATATTTSVSTTDSATTDAAATVIKEEGEDEDTAAANVDPKEKESSIVALQGEDPELQSLQQSDPQAQPSGNPRRRELTLVRHPPALDLVELGTANATGWFVLYDILTLLGARFQYRCQIYATGNILLLVGGGVKFIVDIWTDKSLQLWDGDDASVSLLPICFFAYSAVNVCVVVGCIVLGHQTNYQWNYAKVEIRAAQRELAMIEGGHASAVQRDQARKTAQLLTAIAKEMKELNFVRPIRIMGVRADMKLLATVGTALATVVGVISGKLSAGEGSAGTSAGSL